MTLDHDIQRIIDTTDEAFFHKREMAIVNLLALLVQAARDVAEEIRITRDEL